MFTCGSESIYYATLEAPTLRLRGQVVLDGLSSMCEYRACVWMPFLISLYAWACMRMCMGENKRHVPWPLGNVVNVLIRRTERLRKVLAIVMRIVKRRRRRRWRPPHHMLSRNPHSLEMYVFTSMSDERYVCAVRFQSPRTWWHNLLNFFVFSFLCVYACAWIGECCFTPDEFDTECKHQISKRTHTSTSSRIQSQSSSQKVRLTYMHVCAFFSLACWCTPQKRNLSSLRACGRRRRLARVYICVEFCGNVRDTQTFITLCAREQWIVAKWARVCVHFSFVTHMNMYIKLCWIILMRAIFVWIYCTGWNVRGTKFESCTERNLFPGSSEVNEIRNSKSLPNMTLCLWIADTLLNTLRPTPTHYHPPLRHLKSYTFSTDVNKA